MGRALTPTVFNSLKARVKAEMLRRNGYGDMSAYGADDIWGYTRVPATGYVVKVAAEHFDKINTPLRAVNPNNLPAGFTVAKEADIVTWEARLALMESQPRSAITGNDCASLCSGTCITQCTGECVTGCTGGCNTGCGRTCDGCSGCDGSCYGSCLNNCTSGCANKCSGSARTF